MKSPILIAAAAAMFIAVPGFAEAQNAVTTGNVNMRIGPGTNHPVITTLHRGASVHVHGCVRGYSWCDTSYRNVRGWVSAGFLVSTHARYRSRQFREVAPAIGIGIVAGTIFREMMRDRDRREVRRSPPPRRWHDRQRSRWEERRGGSHDGRTSRWRR
jgi:uncharacterized protein YraI